MSTAMPRLANGRYGMRHGRKYNNVPTRVGERVFASKREAARYDQLKLLERNGEVRDILCQVPFKLEINGRHICRYIADFVYCEVRNGIWAEVVEDVKGYRTAMYNLKKKLMRAIHGIEVRET